MAEQLSTPRITAPYLDSFVGRHVLLVGKVTQLRGEQATLDSEGTVTVVLNRVSLPPTAPLLCTH
jgi:replication factor A3